MKITVRENSGEKTMECAILEVYLNDPDVRQQIIEEAINQACQPSNEIGIHERTVDCRGLPTEWHKG